MRIKIGGSAEAVKRLCAGCFSLYRYGHHHYPAHVSVTQHSQDAHDPLTAPLGMIGVTPALLLTGRPMGFVVQLGILALAGIIIRNSVILIDQIDRHIDAGEPLWDAIFR